MFIKLPFISLCIILACIVIFSCNNKKVNEPTASSIIQLCIEEHGGAAYENMNIAFDFRKHRVHLKNDNGKYLFERSYKDSLGNSWQETLTNEGFSVLQNNSPADITYSAKTNLKEGLNAIAYFALLPYKLADPAVHATYIGNIELSGRVYNKISVTFSKENGGKDHHDEFCFWIDEQTHQLSYLAYSNGGPRFRKVLRQNKCGGIIIQDYENYAMNDTTITTAHYDSAFIKGKFSLLSLIEQTNFQDLKKTP